MSKQSTQTETTRFRFREFFGLERNVVTMSLAVFLLGLGEELWTRFMPKYMEALGAGAVAIGLYGTARDFLDAIYQYPGGWVSDRFGSRRALLLFSGVATLGYITYLLSPTWPLLFVGLALVMAWASLASPAIFATIAESLPPQKRTMGFTVQSILKRVPILIAPTIGGSLIAAYGFLFGIRICLAITVVLGMITILVQRHLYSHQPVAEAGLKGGLRGIFKTLHPAIKRLLLSDIFVRTCEGMVNVFVVLYVINRLGISPAQYGALVAVQMGTSIAVYIPAARLASRYGRKPFVVATFTAFSLFPVAVVVAQGFVSLAIAFVIGGLREIGDPARKALIVDLAQPQQQGRTVGLYYLIRSLSITPASFVGGLLWKIDPTIPFFVASVIGFIGTILFALTVEKKYAV